MPIIVQSILPNKGLGPLDNTSSMGLYNRAATGRIKVPLKKPVEVDLQGKKVSAGGNK